MNFFSSDISFLDAYLEHLGFEKLARKYSGKGLTLRLTLSESRYKRIIVSSDFEKRLDEIINSEFFDNDLHDIVIDKDGHISLSL